MAPEQVCRRSYNPSMGARPLKRIVERMIMTSLSRLIFQNEIESGCKVHLQPIRQLTVFCVHKTVNIRQSTVLCVPRSLDSGGSR